MTTEYAWSDLRTRLMDACGDAPSAPLEDRIITVFERRPMLVAESIEGIIKRHERGLIRSPWAVLAKHVEELAAAEGRALSVTATDSRNRELRVAQARQWMHTAGLHFDREDEIDDELFGERGSLRWWRDDQALVSEMLSLWAQLRPLGVMSERAAIEYGERLLATRRVAAERLKAARAALVDKQRKHEPVPTSNPFLA